MLVSFTATAGQDVGGTSVVEIDRLPPSLHSGLDTGPSLLTAASAFRLPGLLLSDILAPAALSPEQPTQISPRLMALEPRSDLKQAARTATAAFPQIDRTLKGDQLLPLRPTISAQTRGLAAVWPDIAKADLDRLLFGIEGEGVVSAGFNLELTNLALLGPQPFELPKPVTPADEIPHETAGPDMLLAAAPPEQAAPQTTLIPKAPPNPVPSPRYADLISQASEFREMRCLAE
ncbi:MAG: hypothetical protein ACRCUE_00905, partial [Bosea sp. (in: a-proteobacteria)]